MHPRTLARSVLLIAATVFIVLITFGTVGLIRVWTESSGVQLSLLHKAGITALAIVLALVLLGQITKLIFGEWRLPLTTKDELNTITNLISILHPARQLLKDSDVGPNAIEKCLENLCNGVEATCPTVEDRRTIGDKLVAILKSDYPDYKDDVTLSIAHLAPRFSWLPQPEGSLVLVARIKEVGALGNITRILLSRGDPYADVASQKYQNELRRLELGTRFVGEITERLNRPPMLSREGKKDRPRQLSRTLSSFTTQCDPAS